MARPGGYILFSEHSMGCAAILKEVKEELFILSAKPWGLSTKRGELSTKIQVVSTEQGKLSTETILCKLASATLTTPLPLKTT
ncbi:hypothetical protein [Sutcliffiella rhizosphaerae]|uniref:Uncharacterized protein n=1 Tax=Sutcliffiella rhizosphaerae TaxID=2880967 RepID=A0ABN8A4W9_9BACI|nr:hypothetical protein [Sutcliffiella rhizosphaerae]CAG9620161.1 hypothetical protein BACCIP111883_00929 [Sutcliffiella rhizosphaerae]